MRKILLIAAHRVIRVAGHWAYWSKWAAFVLFALLGLGLSAIEYWALAHPDGFRASAPRPSAPASSAAGPANFTRFSLTPFAEAVGYVDEAGLIRYLPAGVPAGKLVRFATVADAQAAARAGQIAGYYLIPADYVAGAQAAFYSPTAIYAHSTDQVISNLLVANLSQAGDAVRAWRVAAPASFQTPQAGHAGMASLPALVWKTGGLLLLLIITIPIVEITTPYWVYLLQDERRDGVLEVLLSSVSARQFVLGKLLATAVLTSLDTGGPLLGLALLNGIWDQVQSGLVRLGVSGAVAWPALPAGRLWPLLAALLGGLLFFDALLSLAGVQVRSPEQAGTVTTNSVMLFMLLFLVAYVALLVLGETLSLTLSLVPLISTIFMPLRLLAGPVPLWQVGLGLSLSLAAICLCVGLAVHLFRKRQQRWGLV